MGLGPYSGRELDISFRDQRGKGMDIDQVLDTRGLHAGVNVALRPCGGISGACVRVLLLILVLGDSYLSRKRIYGR